MKWAAKNLAETQFEAYLAERGIAGGEDHHPELGAAKNPDYRISRDGPPAIVELKGCENSRMHERLLGSRGAMVLSDDDVYGSTRNTIKKATRRLRPYAGRGEALIVGVANPKKIWTPTEDAQEMIAVLHGNPAFSVPISIASGEAVASGESICAEDGVFGGGLHRYVSGVLTLHERTKARDAVERWHEENRPRWDAVADRRQQMVVYLEARDEALETAEAVPGSYRFVRVFETLSAAEGADAAPVPRDLFDGPLDELWTVDPTDGKVERVR